MQNKYMIYNFISLQTFSGIIPTNTALFIVI